MKNFRLHSFIKIPLLLAILSPFSIVHAELVNNGSLSGTIGNNTLPVGWFAGSTTAEKPNSPDTMNESNNVGVTNLLSFMATPSASPDRGSWIGVGADANRVDESFSQVITSFEIGEIYDLSWYDANFGYKRRGYLGENQFIAYLSDGVSDEFTFTGTMKSVGEGWSLQTFSFIPTKTQYTLTFKLANSTKSYLSIDGISIDFSNIDPVAPVPEPETYAMMLAGLAMLGFLTRRRKS